MRRMIGLDFETYSAVDLTVHGLERYVSDPTFTPLCASVSEARVMTQSFDFVLGHPTMTKESLFHSIAGADVIAHNAGFERAVLRHMNLLDAPHAIYDSAVAARVAGGNGSLFQASRQFLSSSHKMEEGRELMRLFSMPGKYQVEKQAFDPQVVHDHPREWNEYKRYCNVDAEGGLMLFSALGLSPDELSHSLLTFEMNDVGWPVDRDVVEEMYARYLENQAQALNDFIVKHDAAEFNINSYPQQVAWCEARGINAKSFDEKNVARLHGRIVEKLGTMGVNGADAAKAAQYQEVLDFLELKQVMGGSSPKKLKTLLDTIAQDEDGTWRLKDQYLHAGAPQTLRTTGRSVQMQNLKKLKHARDMESLFDPDIPWTNSELAENIRQCFTSSRGDGALIVGDFAAVESRGLAYQANETWKLQAYRDGRPVYEELAGRIYGVDSSLIHKGDARRDMGKVGELSCGYGAAGDAVKEFAEKMGVYLNDAQAGKLVWDWRDACPSTVAYWELLDRMIHEALAVPGGVITELLPHIGNRLVMWTKESPQSLRDLFPRARSLFVEMTKPNGDAYMTRVFHGAHETGRNVRYFKPSKNKGGDVWKNTFIHPKTKQRTFYEIYGAKMSGILTQSFCRQLFFDQLTEVYDWAQGHGNVDLIGQFHDEIVLDWWPAVGALQQVDAEHRLRDLMSGNRNFPDFPLAAEVKSSYRYIK